MPDIELSLQAELTALRQQVAALTKEKQAANNRIKELTWERDTWKEHANGNWERLTTANERIKELTKENGLNAWRVGNEREKLATPIAQRDAAVARVGAAEGQVRVACDALRAIVSDDPYHVAMYLQASGITETFDGYAGKGILAIAQDALARLGAEAQRETTPTPDPSAPERAAIAQAVAAHEAEMERQRAALERPPAEAAKETTMNATNFLTFGDYNVARDYVQKLAPPITIRCVGMQGGSGMKVCSSQAEALEALKEAMADRIFGKTCDKVRIYGDLQPPAEPAPVQGPFYADKACKDGFAMLSEPFLVRDSEDEVVAYCEDKAWPERIARALNLLAEKEANDAAQ